MVSQNPDLLHDSNQVFPEQPDHRDALLSHVTVLGEYEGMLLAMVPMDFIQHEDVPVDDKHVSELSKSIRTEAEKGQGTGQLSPALLAQVEGCPKLLIADGFHRTASLKNLGRPSVLATLRLNTTFEELIDLRILSANTHSVVSFGRVVEWVNDAWTHSPWAERITVLQAFGLMSPHATGRNLGVTPEEVAGIREWVADKSRKWNMAPTTVRANIAIADSADPDLTKLVRHATPGDKARSRYVFTRQHLGAIAEGLPGYEYYSRQRLVADLAMKQRLSVLAIEELTSRLRRTKNLAHAVKVVNAVDWTALKNATARGRPNPTGVVERRRRVVRASTPPPTPLPRRENAVDVIGRELVVSELEMGRLALEATVLRGTYSPRHRVSSVARTVIVPDSETEVSKLLMPVDFIKNRENLGVAVERITPRTLATLAERHGFTNGEAFDVLSAAVESVESDFEYGDLRFVQVDKDSVVYDLLTSSIGVEIARRKNIFKERGSANGNPETAARISHLSLKAVFEAAPHIDRRSRRVMVYHGLLGLTIPTSAALLGHKPSALPSLLETAHARITATPGRVA